MEFAITHVVRGVEIFRVGRWNGENYSLSDLKAMIDAFPQQGFTPPVKIGHSKQIGEPAYGWIKNLRLEGEVLVADFHDVPPEVYELIRGHRYDAVSSELFWNFKVGDKTFPRVLKAVALLGSEVPAVAGLKPLRETVHKEGTGEVHLAHDPGKWEKQKMDKTLEQLQAELTQANAKVTQLTSDLAAANTKAADATKAKDAAEAKVVELTKKDEVSPEVKEMQERVARIQENSAKAVREALTTGVRVPAFRPLVGALASALVTGEDMDKAREFSVKDKDGKDEKVTGEALVRRVVDLVNAFAKKLFGQATETVVDRSESDDDNDVKSYTRQEAGDEVAKRIVELQNKEPKIDYREARNRVLSADPVLKKAYAA